MDNLKENKLTLKTFFKIIKKAGRISGSRDNIAIDLFQNYAEIHVSESKIKEALKGRRPSDCDVEMINEKKFLRYFEERISSTWRNMQEEFCSSGGYRFINCDTQDEKEFYRSLLDEFYDLIRVVPMSLCHCLPAKSWVIGRENELEQLTNFFKLSNYAVITGVGGIGKSCLASAYAHKLNEKGGWIIQYIICEDYDTLETAIGKVKFKDREEKKPKNEKEIKEIFDSRIEYFKKTQKSVLLILDNLSLGFDKDTIEDLKKLREVGNHVRILITSRGYIHKADTIFLQPMKMESLLELYKYYRFTDNNTGESYIAEHKDILEKIFNLIGQHTLMIEIFAKLVERCFLSEEKLYDILSKDLNLPSEKIFVSKDDIDMEVTEKEMLMKIFDISQLTTTEKSTMQYMTMIPYCGVPVSLFEELSGCKTSTISNLKRGHWIMEDEETREIHLHPLICEAILSIEYGKELEEMGKNFLCRVQTKQKEAVNDKFKQYTLSKIVACIASRIYFFPIKNDPLFYHLRPEYSEAVLFLNNFMKKYSNGMLSKDFVEKSEFKTLGGRIQVEDDE